MTVYNELIKLLAAASSNVQQAAFLIRRNPEKADLHETLVALGFATAAALSSAVRDERDAGEVVS